MCQNICMFQNVKGITQKNKNYNNNNNNKLIKKLKLCKLIPMRL